MDREDEYMDVTVTPIILVASLMILLSLQSVYSPSLAILSSHRLHRKCCEHDDGGWSLTMVVLWSDD
jgi:hypothetical protein